MSGRMRGYACRANFDYWVGHRLTGDGIDCGSYSDLSKAIREIEARYGALIDMDTPEPTVVRFWTYHGYLIVLTPYRHDDPFGRSETMSELSVGADLA